MVEYSALNVELSEQLQMMRFPKRILETCEVIESHFDTDFMLDQFSIKESEAFKRNIDKRLKPESPNQEPMLDSFVDHLTT